MEQSTNDVGMILRTLEGDIRRELFDLEKGMLYTATDDKVANIRRLALSLRFELTGNGWVTPEWAAPRYAAKQSIPVNSTQPGYKFNGRAYCRHCANALDTTIINDGEVMTTSGNCSECGDHFVASCKQCKWYNLTRPMVGEYCYDCHYSRR